MKKIFLIFIFLLAVTFSYAQDIDQNYINSRVEKMFNIFLDTTNKKFEGFDRHDINTYWENTFNDDNNGVFPFMMYRIKNNDVTEIKEYKLFPPYSRSIAQSKWYGAYLTALEINGFNFSRTFMMYDFSYLEYIKNIGDKIIKVWVAEKNNSVELSMF